MVVRRRKDRHRWRGTHVPFTGATISASPIPIGGDLVAVNALTGAVSTVRADDGNPRWQYVLEHAVPDDWEYGLEPIEHVVDEASETVAVEGRLFAAPYLVGLDLETGSLEWTVDGRESDLRSTEPGDGLLARDGTVYAVTETEDRDLHVRSIDAATGERGWERTLSRSGSGHAGFAADERALYHVGSLDRSGTDPIAVTALALEDGHVRWTETFDDGPITESGPESATGSIASIHRQPPTVAGDAVLVPSDRGLHALEKTSGDHLWTFTELVGTSGGSEVPREATTPPVVVGDRVVIGTTLAVYGLDLEGERGGTEEGGE
ncbi:outer membrane protein assembly factor BamB family protein [Halobiforma nitratireducens]|uniref:outer membrane protein assembly factor BamB family protein n=1 Tax=Halobiforma nitratireducens TaxID=130048 RepID=UPI001EFA0257|nr:PQQ-binding-like beta-propeller repeat protein [Halobiforma nitratireducens]